MNLSKAFYRFNFWFGILIFISPIISSFTIPYDCRDYFYGRVEEEYITIQYLFYKIGGFVSNGYSDGFAEASVIAILLFIFYFLFFIFYFFLYISSYLKIGNAFESIKTLDKTKKFIIGCLILHFGVIVFGTPDNKDYGSSPLEFICWILCFVFYYLALAKYQNYILNNFDKYIIFFCILCLIPVFVILVCKHLTLLNYQLLLFTNPIRIYIESPWIYISLIFSPISYMAMPLFFSFNHYMSVKKLIMENTKEELPKDFFKFKFSFKDA